MANLDVYSYFNAEDTRLLLLHSKGGTRSMLSYLKDNFSEDLQDLIFAIADCMPQLIAEDRAYKSGPRKGERKVVFYNIDTDISGAVAQELVGVKSIKEFLRAYDYMEKSMVETVLTSESSTEPYMKHWVKTFLDDLKSMPQVKAHYHNMITPHIINATAEYTKWRLATNPDINEVMTWDSNKFNNWYFTNGAGKKV